MPRIIATLIALLALCMVSCTEFCCLPFVKFNPPSSHRVDKEVRASLDEKLTEWNENGTFPLVDYDFNTTGYLKEWRFKNDKLEIIFDYQKAHPVISRFVTETITTEWYKLYPKDMKPRFILTVYAYVDVVDHSTKWGTCKVKKNGKPKTHWYATDVY
jgi:hypothetical protein